MKKLHADLGIIITASHNDKRFNGLKIMNNLGGPFKKSQNNQIIKEINITKSASSILTQFLNKNMKIGKIFPNLKFDFQQHRVLVIMLHQNYFLY